MDATTARLVDFASRAQYSALSSETVHECKCRLIDTPACAVAADDKPLSVNARAVARRYASENCASAVPGCTWKTMPEAAAFANGIMMRYLDMMDTCLGKARGHPSDVIAGILAVGEEVHADGASIINAITLAYDVFCTFCDTVDINSRGWDQPVCVVLATATGIGKLLGCTKEQMGNAVALTVTPNMALFCTRRGKLSQWKGCAAANGARNAVFAAYLVKQGFTGPAAVFAGKYGLWDAIGRFDWQFTVGPGAPHRVTQTDLKCFPIVYHAQPVAWADLQIRKRLRVPDISERRRDIELPRRVTTGHRTPIEMTSLGRAYLATLPAKERDILFARFRVKHRDHWEDLEHEIQHAIDQVHNEGYCEVNWLPGVTAIATPVRITGQTYVINIGVSSRSLHATRIRNELAPALLALANDLESAFASGESKKAQKKRADVRRGAHSAE